MATKKCEKPSDKTTLKKCFFRDNGLQIKYLKKMTWLKKF
jgi:hypothetical protein